MADQTRDTTCYLCSGSATHTAQRFLHRRYYCSDHAPFDATRFLYDSDRKRVPDRSTT